MSFEINRLNNKPIIKEAQNAQDGGAGNLGYFEQEEKQKKKKNDSIFSSASDESDSFQRHDSEEQETFSMSKLIAQVILAVKNWVKKYFA